MVVFNNLNSVLRKYHLVLLVTWDFSKFGWMRVGVLNSFLRLANTPTLIPWEKALVFQVFSFLLHSSVIHIAKIKDASLVVEK